MTIAWSTQITNVNSVTKQADVIFTRTDSTGVQPQFTMAFDNAILETPAQRLALLDQVWGEYQVRAAKDAAASDFIDNLEQVANSNLMAREV